MNVIKTLAKEIREFRRASILTPFFMILEVVVETMIPFLMSRIIDLGINKGDMKAIAFNGTLMLLMALAGLATGVAGGFSGVRAAMGFGRNLRKAMFRNIQTFSFANIDRFSPAGLVTRLTTDVTNVQNAYLMLLRMFVRAPFSMICAMIMAYTINVRIANVYLIAVVLLGVFVFFMMSRVTGLFRAMFKKYDALNENIEENVSGVRAVKAFVREDHMKGRFLTAVEEIYRLSVQAESNMVLIMPVMTGTVYAVILAISWLGAHMIVQNTLTTGSLMSLLAYCMNILMSLMMLSLVFVMVSMSTASAQRIAEVLTEESSLRNPPEPIYDVADGSVVFQHVSFSYKDGNADPVLTDIDLTIESGETIGIIGGTGSSKSSLVNLIPRLYDVSSGRVLVGGFDVREYDLRTLRDQVAVVLQQNVLFSGTILENLRWGRPDATEEECREACRMACADEFIMRFPDGYGTMISQGGTNVSGGQKQRLCIARALLKDPRILILDDSTSAVDTATERRIRDALSGARPDMTKIIITQRVSSIENADRVIVMEEGRVSGFDTPENLLKNNRIYQEVYAAQKEGGGDFDIVSAVNTEGGNAASAADSASEKTEAEGGEE